MMIRSIYLIPLLRYNKTQRQLFLSLLAYWTPPFRVFTIGILWRRLG